MCCGTAAAIRRFLDPNSKRIDGNINTHFALQDCARLVYSHKTSTASLHSTFIQWFHLEYILNFLSLFAQCCFLLVLFSVPVCFIFLGQLFSFFLANCSHIVISFGEPLLSTLACAHASEAQLHVLDLVVVDV